MYEIPLFPLNTVLFPGMPLPLHIFEERYKDMIADCLRENRPFGVVLMGDGPAEPYAVGCTAEIAQVQPLDEGRMLIMTVGRERFRIVRLAHDRPYLVGMVESAPLQAEDEIELAAAAAELEPLVMSYLHKLAQLGSIEMEPDNPPDDALSLVYLGATLIQLPPEEKQAFLSMDRAGEMAAALGRVYRRELSLMRHLPPGDVGIFSLN